MGGGYRDKVVIVTGGAGGIGSAACRAIGDRGRKGRRRRPRRRRKLALSRTTSSRTAGSPSPSASTSPIASQVQAMIRTAVETFGELNVIFNNAGMNRPRGFMDVDEANFDEIVRVNTWGVIVCTQEAAKQMIAQGSGGKIVNTGSIASRQGFWDFVPYCVAKFGTLAVTQATARGLIEHGITVNAFAPGVVDTPMWIGLNEDIRAIHGEPADADPMREFASRDADRPARRPDGARAVPRVPRLRRVGLHDRADVHGRRWADPCLRRLPPITTHSTDHGRP